MARIAPSARLPWRTPKVQSNPHPYPSSSDWDICRKIARTHGRTFYFACHLLPPKTRRAIHAVYAWCRTADDLVDTATPETRKSVLDQLDAWETSIHTPFDPASRTFAWVVSEYGVPVEPARNLVNGVRMDLDTPRFSTWNDLHWYSYCVAGTVGLMIAPILGCHRNAALSSAVDLGVAMQLTNILRDVAEDAAMGRVYLPDEDLDRFNVSRQSLLNLRPDGDFRGLMQFEIKRARRLYQQANQGIPALSRTGQLTTLAGGHLYREILRQIEDQDYDVFRKRATVPTQRKIREMPWVMRSFLRMQWSGLGYRLFP